MCGYFNFFSLFPSLTYVCLLMVHKCRELVLYCHHRHWHINWIGLLWTRDRPVAGNSTWQHKTLKKRETDRCLCPRRDSNTQSQQASGRRLRLHRDRLPSFHGAPYSIARNLFLRYLISAIDWQEASSNVWHKLHIRCYSSLRWYIRCHHVTASAAKSLPRTSKG